MTNCNFSIEEKGKNKLTLEGNVCQKGECRPIANTKYMNLKKEAIRQASVPVRSVKTLDKAVAAYKPISVHKADVSYFSMKIILNIPSLLG